MVKVRKESMRSSILAEYYITFEGIGGEILNWF